MYSNNMVFGVFRVFRVSRVFGGYKSVLSVLAVLELDFDRAYPPIVGHCDSNGATRERYKLLVWEILKR
jgi:hypothetical protein